MLVAINKVSFEDLFKKHPKRLPVQELNLNSAKRTVGVNFFESVKVIFEHDLQIKLYHSPQYNNYWHGNLTDDEIQRIKEWKTRLGNIIFIRSLLDACIALSINFDEDVNAKKRTELGELEYQAKWHKDENSIQNLAKKLLVFIEKQFPYKNASAICAIPCAQDKSFDLSRELAKLLATNSTRLSDITAGFTLTKKTETKRLSHSKKWDYWDASDLKWKAKTIPEKIILLDDKYQSGATMHYTAMKLYQAGAKQIYGLNIVKTMADDN